MLTTERYTHVSSDTTAQDWKAKAYYAPLIQHALKLCVEGTTQFVSGTKQKSLSYYTT